MVADARVVARLASASFAVVSKIRSLSLEWCESGKFVVWMEGGVRGIARIEQIVRSRGFERRCKVLVTTFRRAGGPPSVTGAPRLCPGPVRVIDHTVSFYGLAKHDGTRVALTIILA